DIVIVGDNVAVTASAVTTLGGSQGTWTQARLSNDVFRGIAIHQHVEKTAAGVAQYAANDAVSVGRKCLVWVPVHVNVTIDETAYVNVQVDGYEGQFTNVSSNNITTGGTFRSSALAGALAKLEIDL
ncbi:MAG: hypothetical protein KJN62_07715, partial [Deltaproteobacteria bacterium]|nr:hypothetical protein [Deltaproteobacteria bacterium]